MTDNTAQIQNHFKPHGNPERAQKMTDYMRGKFACYGIMATERRMLTREAFVSFGSPDPVFEEVQALFNQPYRELHYLGMELMFKTKKQWNVDTVEELEWLIVHNSWWDTVDYIASTLVGHYFKTFPEMKEERLNAWNASDNMWLVRTSIIFQLKYKQRTDTALLEKMIVPHVAQKEFFIRKAIGWALREYSKVDPIWVREFIGRVDLQPLSLKEASKYI